MKKYILFISYDGLLDPLGKSQILPYIFGLNDFGYNFILISYEKEDRNNKQLEDLKNRLKSKGIIWYKLRFKRGRIKRLLRIINGALTVRRISRKYNIKLVHLRALQPSVIYCFSLINKPFIYDMRAFAGQWVDMRAIRKGSILEFIIYWYEKWLIRKASAMVVLDKSGSNYLKESYKVIKPYKVIPTATNLQKYTIKEKQDLEEYTIYKFVFLGGARFPYLPKEALIFLKLLIQNGYNCQIDFINESDHQFIYEAIDDVNFPKDRINIFTLNSDDICKKLPDYDCGLVFISTGPWLRMCSPTKIGEYLAAGLHIVGLQGLEVLDRLSSQTDCIDIVETRDNKIQCSKKDCLNIINNIENKNRSIKARAIANENYDLVKALNTYAELYSYLIK